MKLLSLNTIHFLLLLPIVIHGQWNAVPIAENTYNSVLRPMSQGVYDHYSDKSFLCFMQENSNPYVVECDHSSGEHIWGDPQLVYTQPTASKYNYPTIDILPDRRLVLCYASPFDDALGFAISDSPADPSSWTTTTIDIGLRRNVEYPRIKVDRFGNIYLFYVHMDQSKAAHKRWYYYVKSEDYGQTWSEPVLSIQRELDDPYGMCEIYMGYTVEEPYRVGEPERWWFAYTSSSGFQFEGTHTGDDGSSYLEDSTQSWGDGGNFSYRWLYNVTKGSNSGIDQANSTAVYPASEMVWDKGDAYGIAYHNIYHSDIYVTYFRPDNGNWYDANHNNLGKVVSRAEMESNIGRAYKSPTPPSSKDVGYVPVLTVNNEGKPAVFQNGTFYSWNHSQWEIITPEDPINDLRYLWFTEGKYYTATNKISINNSLNISNWSNVGSSSLPNNNRFAIYAVHINEGHAEAIFNAHEYNSQQPGTAWGVSARETQIPKAMILRTATPKIETGDTALIHAYITDKVHGARSRVRDADNLIEMSVIKGSANIIVPSINATSGLATFKVISNSTESEVITLKASSDSLDDYYINLSLNEGITSKIKKHTLINDDNSPISKFSIADNKLSISFNDILGMDISIINLSGQKIRTFSGRRFSNCSISTKDFSAGLYLLLVNCNNKYWTKPFVITK